MNDRDTRHVDPTRDHFEEWGVHMCDSRCLINNGPPSEAAQAPEWMFCPVCGHDLHDPLCHECGCHAQGLTRTAQP